MNTRKQELEKAIVKAARNYSYNCDRQFEFPNSPLLSDLLYTSAYALLESVKDIEDYEGQPHNIVGMN